MENVLVTKQLTKSYHAKKAADHIDMHIAKGDIYGFIGKNGAGKTTLMKMVCGLIFPGSGEIELFGSTDLSSGRKKIGSVIEQPAVFAQMDAKENIGYYSRLRGMKGVDADELLKMVGLEGCGNKKAKNFSLGMKQRLSIAIAMIGKPEFLVLDEPINGLDPAGIREVRKLLLHLNRDRKITILISSHILGELGKVATRYGVIRDGRLIEEFSAEELENRSKSCVRITVDKVQPALKIINEQFGVERAEEGDNNSLLVYGCNDRIAEINAALVKKDIMVSHLALSGQDMESYILSRMEG